MNRPALPSSPAADLHAPRAAGVKEATHRRRRHLVGIVAAAAVVVVFGSVASAALAVIGTGSCEGDGDEAVCVARTWWPFTIQQRAEVWSEGGVPHGPRLEWHKNGTPWFTGSSERGLRSGPWREYWPSGVVRFSGTYVRDRLDGEERWFFADGGLEWSVSHRDGTRHGVERWFWPGGSLRREGHWVDGEKHGPFTSWSEEGHGPVVVEYRHGVRVER